MTEDLRMQGACAYVDPELFFPIAGEGTPVGDLQRAEAKGVCHRCPVISACLTWALESGQDYGVWGGMTEDERRKLKRRKAEPVPGPVAHAIDATHNGYGAKVTTLHTPECKHVRRLAAERKRPVHADEVTAVWAAAFGGERGPRFCRACKPWQAIPGLHEAEELYRPLPGNNNVEQPSCYTQELHERSMTALRKTRVS